VAISLCGVAIAMSKRPFRSPPIPGHAWGRRSIPKAAWRLRLASGKFLPFSNRPHLRRSVATCDFLKADTCRWGLEQLILGQSRQSASLSGTTEFAKTGGSCSSRDDAAEACKCS
jgi:hypothetical protein